MRRPLPPDVSNRDGYRWVAEPDREWRLVSQAKNCRYWQAHDDAVLATAEFNRGTAARPNWYAYCPEHMYGRWVEGGAVLHWQLRSVSVSSGPREKTDRNAELVAAWEAGTPAFVLAKRYGITKERVRQLVVRAGYSGSKHPFTPAPKTCPTCGKDYTGGLRAHARAAIHRLHPTSRPGLAPKTLAMAAEYRAGGDTNDIAARYGVSRVSVYRAGILVYGPQRYGDAARTKPRTPRTIAAVADLVAGRPIWWVADHYSMNRAQAYRLLTRYVAPKVPA